ncbi:hypothetical protein HPP92_028219 [Vanilla planifolia]|uniref:Proton pump-interactor 1 n=1 Tax=Vanilla planifolia TaxID=51239 RepID=A0A835P664_VANPL|nr:hypothetical protein HPP92_028219 [Vanilla planifolia]
MLLIRDEVFDKKKMNKADGSRKSDSLDHSNELSGEIKESGIATDATVPKDAVDEWPAPKQLHTFYFVRYRSHEDPKLKTKIEQADKEVQRKTQIRVQIIEALRAKKSEKADLISQLKPLQEEEKQFRTVMNVKRMEMEPLQVALGKLRGTKNASSEKGATLCYSEEELDDTIQSLEYRIQHESNTLTVEKQLLKEIKQLEASRQKVKASDAMRVKIQESFGQRDAIQDQVKLIGADLDGARKEQQAIRTKIQHLEERLNAVRTELDSLQEELQAINLSRDKAYQALTMLRKERDDSNACFYQYRSLMNTVKGLVTRNDTTALEELSLNEVEKFFSHWSSSKAFRDNYETTMLSSLDMRQLSRDARIRNADEKPILSNVSVSVCLSIEADKEPAKVVIKKQKEVIPPPQDEALPISKPREQIILTPDVDPAAERTQTEPPKSDEVDPAKLKEMKKEQENAKAKLAMERKKKLAEKAGAKAAIRAQKEAEKKQKEKDKKAKKKVGLGDLQQAERETNDIEPVLQEEPNLNADHPAPENSKEIPAETMVRTRGRRKGPSHIPKVILKRKKLHSYWIWAAPGAVCALVLVLLGYYSYSLRRSQ